MFLKIAERLFLARGVGESPTGRGKEKGLRGFTALHSSSFPPFSIHSPAFWFYLSLPLCEKV